VEPFRCEKGFERGDTTVTVNVPYGVSELFDFQNYEPERLVEAALSAARRSSTFGPTPPSAWAI
jgi:hypothetical protein